MNGPDFDLAANFPPADREVWKRAVERVLHGRGFDSVLVSKTRDGLDINPLYTAHDIPVEEFGSRSGSGAVPVGSDRVRGGWDVRQRHGGTDPLRCNREILEDLNRGVTSVELETPRVDDIEAHIRAALTGIRLDRTPVALAPHTDVESARALLELIDEGASESASACWLGLDPLGGITRGEDSSGLAGRVGEAAELAAGVQGRYPRMPMFTVDTTRHAAAGATEAQQLAVSLATGVAYLRACDQVGVGADSAASIISFRFDATADQFITIATLRAARRTWARLLQASGVEPRNRVQIQHAVTSQVMYSRRDPWVNLLRATTATLAAGVAGADSVTVLAFDSVLGRPDSLGRRMARNTQILLIEESNISRLLDPTAGSWFVETLTEQLAELAWSGFRAIESAGGIAAVLEDGSLEAEVAASWTARLAGISNRSDGLTGVSEFPDIDETVLGRPSVPDSAGWPVLRPAQLFEDLRDMADRHTAEHGIRPQVFLATLGDQAVHTARSTWVTNLLAVAGIAAVGAGGRGADSPIEAEARFSASGCDVAVICSSDLLYSQRAAATATALCEAGAVTVALVGRPGDLRAQLENAGVSQFWHDGIDVVGALGALLAHLTHGSEQ